MKTRPMDKTRKFLAVLIGCWVLGNLVKATFTPSRAMVNESLRRELERAISKRVARDSQGRYYLLTETPNPQGKPIFALRMAKNLAAKSLDDFSPPMELLFLAGAQDSLFSGAIAIDKQDQLHLVWSTEKGLTGYSLIDLKRLKTPEELREQRLWLHPESQKPGVLVMAEASSRIGDLTISQDGEIWLTWTTQRSGHEVSVYLGSLMNGRWQAFKMVEGYGVAPPTLMMDSQKSFHLAWHDIYEDTYYLSGRVSELSAERKWQAKKLVDFQSFDQDHHNIDIGPARRPLMVAVGSKRMAVFENTYSHLEYVFPGDSKPAKRPITRSDKRFAWDSVHSPQVAIDRYGIPWLFFIESARQRVFYARWLGTKWSEISDSHWLTRNSPRMEDNHVSIERISVEERMAQGAMGIGISLTHQSQFPQTAFYTIPVPSLEATPGKKVLFFDLKEILALSGLELRLNEAKKYAANPVITVGAKDDFDADRGGEFSRVLKENNVYRMWYSGLSVERGRPWWEWYRVGYAESPDGYKFGKVNLGLASFRDKKNTNIIPGLPYVPMVCDDPHDPNPKRRYKLLKFSNHGIQNDEAKAGRLDPWRDVLNGSLLSSPDGIHWKEEPAEIAFPGGRPFSFIPQTLLYDEQEKDPAKKYKAYGFSSLNITRRGGSYAYSSDAVHWTAHAQNPVLDAYARGIPAVRGGLVEQIHDTIVWPYQGYYLALYQYQYDHDKQDVELAVSRDGENFVFIQPGEKLIRLGNPGDFDCNVVTASLPLADKDEIKLYYGGSCGENTGSGGVAILRLDGFTDLQLEENQRSGSLTTIPITRGAASHLYLNADCGENGYLEVELIDATTGRTLPGYSKEESLRITGNSVNQKVTWKSRADLSPLESASFQIKVFFVGAAGSPKLYSFEFK